MATIKEIAQRAGVSTTTVSNVIHGKTKKVSPANIQKIENLIREMGYVQKMGLRVLNKEKSQLIAVVINYHKDFKDSIIGDPFYGKIIGFIEKYVQELGYYLMLYSAKDTDKIFQMVMGWDVDGVIAISFSKSNCEKIYQLINKPIASIDAYGELDAGQESHVLNIGLDDESGGYLMTKYLLECGYEHIQVCAGRDNGPFPLHGSAESSKRIRRKEAEGTVYCTGYELREAKRKLLMAAPAEKTEDCIILPFRSLCSGSNQFFQQQRSEDSGGDRNCRI